ncbi:S-layer homology domain-containing protein [Pseudobacillus sp. 179-B 2D1 NHS]|uniref:S-layer homology domain-containing protein n=1 Tax=Pseudobacillus sp. 179-B 2D1 NHS TaxID=3374292 RepID=UPI003879E717
MKKFKKLTATVGVCALMGLSFGGAAQAASFTDVGNKHRFYSDIDYLTERNIIKGHSDGTFRPNGGVTRGEAAIMISRAFKLETEKGSSFKDISSSETSRHVEAARKAGIIKGYTEDSFRPNEPVSRGQMAMFLSRAFSLSETNNVYFKDVGKNMVAYDSIRRMAAKGMAQGYTDGTYRPDNTVTRGQFSAFLARGLKGGMTPPAQPSKPNDKPSTDKPWLDDIRDDIKDHIDNSDIIIQDPTHSTEFK